MEGKRRKDIEQFNMNLVFIVKSTSERKRQRDDGTAGGWGGGETYNAEELFICRPLPVMKTDRERERVCVCVWIRYGVC